MSYLAIINTPGYQPDVEPAEFDSVDTAWQWLLEQRSSYEEQQVGYEDMGDYSDAVCVLARLAKVNPIPGSKRGPLSVFEARDSQVIGWQLSADDTGSVTLATSLTHHEDHSLPEVYSVMPKPVRTTR